MVYDFETGSKNPNNAQLTQVASIMIEPRKLNIIENSLFSSEIKYMEDDEAIAEGLAPLEQEALTKTNKTREQLALAPKFKAVIPNWIENIKRYQTSRDGGWGAPIRCGFNINKFDNIISDRIARKYGHWDNKWENTTMFHPVVSMDLIQDFWELTENIKINRTHSISFESIRDWLGMSKDGAHDAKIDVLDTAELVVRILRMKRKMHTGFDCVSCKTPLKIRFGGALSEWKRPNL